MQLGEAKTGAEFPIIILYNKQKKKKAPAEESYIPGIFLSKSPRLPECTKSNQGLSSPLSLAKLALKMTLKKPKWGGFVCQNKKYATFIETKKKKKE